MHPNTIKNYCPDLYHGLYLEKFDQNQTKIGNCCLQPRNGPVEYLDFDHPFLSRDRQYLESVGELPPSCVICKNSEDIGVTSKRLDLNRRNDQYGIISDFTPVLRDLNYNCDNICNLKCITCDSSNSSAWIDDEVKMGKRTQIKIKHTKHNQLTFGLDISQLALIVFNGGEPLMTLDHFTLLDYVISQGVAKQVALNYNTNATFPVTDRMVEYWKQFLHVQLSASIDGTEECFQYTRFPAKWDEVYKNLIQYKSLPGVGVYISVTVSVTVGLHNILYMDSLLQWAADHDYPLRFNANAQGMLNLKNFPMAYKGHLLTYLTQLPEYPQAGDSADIRAELFDIVENVVTENSTDIVWIQYLDQLDVIRDTKWRNSLSRLYQLDPVYFDSISAG